MLNKFCWVRPIKNRTIFCWVRPIQKWVTYPEMSRISRNEFVGIYHCSPLFYSSFYSIILFIILFNHSIQSSYSSFYPILYPCWEHPLYCFIIYSNFILILRLCFTVMFRLCWIIIKQNHLLLSKGDPIVYGYVSVMIMVSNLKNRTMFCWVRRTRNE